MAAYKSFEPDETAAAFRTSMFTSVAIENESLQAAGVSIVLLNENGRGKAESNMILTQTGGIQAGTAGDIFAAYPALFVGSDAVFNGVEFSTSSGYKQTISIDLKANVCN